MKYPILEHDPTREAFLEVLITCVCKKMITRGLC